MNKKTKVLLYISLWLVFVILSIDFYLSRHYYEPYIEDFFKEPAKYESVKVGLDGPVLNISADSFYMGTKKREIKVYYNNLQKPKLGQVSVLAELRSDGTAKAIELHVNNYNYLKYVLSAIAFVVFLFMFFNEWKFKNWRFHKNA